MTPSDVRELFLQGTRPFAVVDPLEEGLFAEVPHLLRAINVPFGTLEGEIVRRIPDRRTLIIIPRNGDGIGEDSARRIRKVGYKNVEIVVAEERAWAAAGIPLYTGFNVYSKAFGEFLEHSAETPTLDVQGFESAAARKKLALYDVRPVAEYSYETIPGARNVLGVDVGPYCLGVHHLDDEVIVHCGGRTRSIIAAETLRLLGFRNAKSLKNGTMGWLLAGKPLKYAEKEAPLNLDGAAESKLTPVVSSKLQVGFAERDALVQMVTGPALPYCFDLSPPGTSLPGFTSVAGGQLIQATDGYAAVYHAPILLHDRDNVRALIAAYWLRRMGYRAYVIKHEDLDSILPLIQAERERHGIHAQAGGLPEALSCNDTALSASDELFVDASPLRLHEQKRVASAIHFMRRSFDWDAFARLSSGRKVVLYGCSPALCMHALMDFHEHGYDVTYIGKAVDELQEMGLAVMSGRISAGDFYPDEFVRPIERPSNQEAAMAAYLTWEVELLEKMEADRTIVFEAS